jgi:tRNA uridine 5-carboxymethylaminomethyl modification enzyme
VALHKKVLNNKSIRNVTVRLNTSIDYSKLIEQKSDPQSRNFSSLSSSNERSIEQRSCFIAETNSKTLSIIRANKEKSPIFNGQIKGIGPRYCPSIEDKAFRYVDKDIHHVFIEPEGLNLNTVYPNGLSTSLPSDVQNQFIQSTIKSR